MDSPEATTSYAIDIANGGDALVAQNLIVKGRRSLSAKMIVYAAEGLAFPRNAFRIQHNVFIGHRRGFCIGTVNYACSVSAQLEQNGYEGVPIRLLGRGRSRQVLQGQTAIGNGAWQTDFTAPPAQRPAD